MSPYNYSMNNPVMLNDPSGAAPEGDGGNNYLNTIKANGPVEWMNEDGTIDSGIVGNKLNEVVIKPQPSEPSFFASLGFNENGYYRNEYSDGGLKSPGNYLRFLDNAAGSIWNGGVSLASSFKNLFTNFSFEGLSQELSGYYNYYFNNSFSNLWSDTKSSFSSAFSDVKTYENIAGTLLTASASGISKSLATSTETRTFYTIQGVEDASRIRSTGTPWATEPTRAHLGEGIYAWGNKVDANKYLQMNRELGYMNQEIVEFSISEKKFSKFNSKILEFGPDAETFISKYSKIYGEGQPHNFDYIRGLTGNLGAEHYFNKTIFKQLKFKR